MTDPLSGDRNVAIACQGGGSHTAFTAGVLRELFAEWPEDARLVGISGTSGGAICALSAWYGLLTDEHTPGDRLRTVWEELSATGPTDRATNEWVVWGARAEHSGAPIPEVSPSQTPASNLARRELKRALRTTVEFDRISGLAGGEAPQLAVGTVDVNAGTFDVFEDETVTEKVTLATAAVPDIYEAVGIDGNYHWDGLFSQNPPIHELMHVDPERKPDELWVIQINPQESDGEPTSMLEIRDRRNELTGNLSLNQELRFVERVNEWIEDGDLVNDEYSRTEIERIALDEELDYASKLDRDPAFLDDLRERGERTAAEFLSE
jgi:NTE family protein